MAADRVRLMKGVDRNCASNLAHAAQLDSTPQRAMGKLMGLAMFVTTISVSNQQSYSFLSFADSVLM